MFYYLRILDTYIISKSFHVVKSELNSKSDEKLFIFKICTPGLTLKAPITTAADDKFCKIFTYFQKKGMTFHENCLPADNSHEI